MTEKLILEGESIKGSIQNDEISGENFEIWLNKCIYYIETYHKDSSITKKFLSEYENGTQKNIFYFKRMINIIKAFKEAEDNELGAGAITDVYNW